MPTSSCLKRQALRTDARLTGVSLVSPRCTQTVLGAQVPCRHLAWVQRLQRDATHMTVKDQLQCPFIYMQCEHRLVTNTTNLRDSVLFKSPLVDPCFYMYSNMTIIQNNPSYHLLQKATRKAINLQFLYNFFFTPLSVSFSFRFGRPVFYVSFQTEPRFSV